MGLKSDKYSWPVPSANLTELKEILKSSKFLTATNTLLYIYSTSAKTTTFSGFRLSSLMVYNPLSNFSILNSRLFSFTDCKTGSFSTFSLIVKPEKGVSARDINTTFLYKESESTNPPTEKNVEKEPVLQSVNENNLEF